jgi:hypothetical protein
MSIIVNGGAATRGKVLAMFPPTSVGTLVIAMTEAIAVSFETYGAMRNPTMEEKKRRFYLIMSNVLDLRGERKWGVQRICDAMADILKSELSGSKYVPDDKRTFWIKADGV